MRIFAEGVPGDTGRLSSSTSSTMQPSSANTIASSPGLLLPTRPSVEPKPSISGTWNPSVIAARSSGVQVSLVQVTATGAIRSRPARCSAASRASTVG